MRLYLVSALVLLASVIYGIDKILDSEVLAPFHIFDPAKLHALSVASIAEHGNNTKAIVASIVENLRADDSISPYLSVDEQWMFNNAGGAMGAMYIIHASKSFSLF